MDIRKLKSGTDIRGVAIGEGITLSKEAAKRLALGFAMFLEQRGNVSNRRGGRSRPLVIAIGHDSRLSAKDISDAAIEGLMYKCGEVYFCGLSSTPAMFMTTVLNDCDGAIMLTASHHPKNRNGFKFFTKDGGISKTDLDEIIKLAEGLEFTHDNNEATLIKKDFLENYCQHMKDYFIRELGSEKPLKGYKVAVDAGNGAAGFYATRILQPLGADISSSQFLDPDGNFPNHVPNPEDKEAIESISKRVVDAGSDLGIIFDTDGDRSAIVLKDGKEVNRNRLIALSAAIVIEEERERCHLAAANHPAPCQEVFVGHPSTGGEFYANRQSTNYQSTNRQPSTTGKGDPSALLGSVQDDNTPLCTSRQPIIVTDSVTSEGLKEFIEKLGAVHIRYKRGYQNVIGYAKKLCDEGHNAPLAIETSGHGALRENYFLDDGAYLAAKILIKAIKLKREGKDLNYLIKDLKEPLEEKAFRLSLGGENWRKTGAEVLGRLEELGKKYRVAEDSHEGIRVYLEGGFFMARMSVHDPVVAVNLETDNVGGVARIEGILRDALKGIDGINF